MERMTPEEQRRARLARLAQAARDELPYAAQSGLTTSLIAGAQPQNAMVDRRIYQPPLASMEAQNPDPRLGRMGLTNALSDLYAEPGRMLPGSGGWAEGVGAAAPHVAASALDLVNPASWAGRGARGVVAESRNALSQLHLPPVQQVPARVPARGSINPHFTPTGKAGNLQYHAIQLDRIPAPRFESAYHNAGVSTFQKAIRSGDYAKANEMFATEARRYNRRASSTPETDALYDYMEEVLDVLPPTPTRYLPHYTTGTRSSNSNAPTLSRGEQPDLYAPTIRQDDRLHDPYGFMKGNQ